MSHLNKWITFLFISVTRVLSLKVVSYQPESATSDGVWIVRVHSSGIILRWNDTGSRDMQICVQPLSHGKQTEFRVVNLGANEKQYHVKDLLPNTEYEIQMTNGNPQKASRIVFRTGQKPHPFQQLSVHPVEAIVVTGVLLLWIGAVWLFLKKWAKICLLQPREYRFEHEPKNIKTIKVVKRSTDSVIHKVYNAEHHRTVKARQKHLERMNTMPCLKLSSLPPKPQLSPLQEVKEIHGSLPNIKQPEKNFPMISQGLKMLHGSLPEIRKSPEFYKKPAQTLPLLCEEQKNSTKKKDPEKKPVGHIPYRGIPLIVSPPQGEFTHDARDKSSLSPLYETDTPFPAKIDNDRHNSKRFEDRVKDEVLIELDEFIPSTNVKL